MSERSGEPERLDAGHLSDAALIRAAADGELNAKAKLGERSISDQHTRIAFEMSLRHAVGRVMSGGPAPEALKDRVLAALRSASDPASSSTDPIRFVEAKARHEAHEHARAERRHHFMGTRWRRGVAIAAVVGLASAAVWMGVQGGTSVLGSGLSQNAVLINALQFVRTEHTQRAAFDDTYRSSFTVDMDEAVEVARRELGAMPECLARAIRGCRDTGLVFAGLSACPVPGGGGAVHVMYWSVPDESSVSLFIVADPDSSASTLCPTKSMKGETSYVCSKSTAAGSPLQVWRRGGYTFYLASGKNKPVPIVRKLHEAPAQEETLGGL